VRHCRQRRFGRGSYACWGALERVVPAPRGVPVREALRQLAIETIQEEVRVKQRPQDVAAKKLAHARAKVAEATTKMRRLATSLHQWERRAQRYARAASMTDEEVARLRELRRARPAKKARRGMNVKGGAVI
jgi:hypothetical protein